MCVCVCVDIFAYYSVCIRFAYIFCVVYILVFDNLYFGSFCDIATKVVEL